MVWRLNLALVMCLSLWAYYIQIKEEFTDRRQAPAPISNQTVPSGEPCDAHICGHSLTAWHRCVLQESSVKKLWAGVQLFENTGSCIGRFSHQFKSTTKIFHIVYIIFLLQREYRDEERRKKAYSYAVVCLFEGFHSSRLSWILLKRLSESLFVTLLTSFPLPLSDNTMRVLYPCLCAL